jgi:hypothetical protein
MAKSRGRPRNDGDPELAAADERIAQTIYRLNLWGFGLTSDVFDTIAHLACIELGRKDHTGHRALGAERIEQIYKHWLKRHVYLRSFERYHLTHEVPDVNPIFPLRARFTRSSLAAHRPRGSLKGLARKLLQGWHPKSKTKANAGYISPEPELTPKALRELKSFPLPQHVSDALRKLDGPAQKRPRGRPKRKSRAG